MGLHKRSRSRSHQPRHSSKTPRSMAALQKTSGLLIMFISSPVVPLSVQCCKHIFLLLFRFSGDLDIALGNEHDLRWSSKVKGMFFPWNTLFLSLPIFSLQSYTLGVVQRSAAYTPLAKTPPCKQDQDVSWRKGFVITLIFQILFFFFPHSLLLQLACITVV